MGKGKFVRTVSALLMLLAMLLPIAPATAAVAAEEQGDVHAANVSGGVTNPGDTALPFTVDLADCTGSPNAANVGVARYFITIRSTSGLDVTNAVGRIISPTGTVFTMSNGDFESQANDGLPPACVPAVNDGHANDLASPPIQNPVSFGPPGAVWTISISAGGFVPRVFPLPADPTFTPACQVTAGGAPNTGFVCLISLGTLNLQPLAAPAGRGTVAGSIFAANGLPLDGATVVLTDASGLVHTRTSGTDCNGAPAASTGFYCFADSRGDPPTGAFTNDSLGLPVGPATITVVNNTPANCPPTGAPAATTTACGFLPATVTVSVAAGVVVGQDITLQNKFPPVVTVAGAMAFGYIVNAQGQGVGGITVTGGGQTAFCPSPPTGVVGTTPNPPGSCTQTGLWVITGLPAATAVTFTISGPGLSATNVRPGLSVTRTTGAAGTWIDPSWIIIQQGPPVGAIPLPVVGSTIIRGTVTDPQGQPFTGAGAFVLLTSQNTFAGATAFVPGVPAAIGKGVVRAQPLYGFFPTAGPQALPIPVAAAALDAGGNYCFGSGSAPTNGVGVGCPNVTLAVPNVGQPPLQPGSYLVTVIDDRPTVAGTCVPGFQPPAGGIGPAPCGSLPWTSQPVVAQADRVVTVNVQLQAKFAPGSPLPVPGVLGGTDGLFGILWDASVPGGRPLQGGTVYAVPVACPAGAGCPIGAAGITNAGLAAAIPAAGITPATLAAGGAALINQLAAFAASVPLTGAGVLNGAVLTSNPAPAPPGAYPYVNPTYPGSDQLGMYRILGLVPGVTYAVIVEVPGGYNDCAPIDVQVGTPVAGYPFAQTGILQPSTGTIRCATLVTAPPAGGSWAAGADFAFVGQNLTPLEPGETDRRLEAIIPFVGNGAPTAALGGWDLQTNEIRVVNSGAQRTVAEVRFYASDGIGGAAVLAGTQTADLVPGAARTFRSPDMPGGFLGWSGVWSFDADGPGGVYGQGGLVVESMLSARNAGNAAESMSGWSRDEIVSPSTDTMLPLAYKNYGGTENKWSTLLVADNVGDQAPVVFRFIAKDTVRGDARTCRVGCTITRYANRGGMVTLNMGDTSDPDIALLPDGTFSVDITVGGVSPISGFQGVLPGQVEPNMPGGYLALGINVSTTGKMMTTGRSQSRESGNQAGAGWFGPPDTENTGILYAPLLFNNSNGWNSGIAIASSETTGATSVAVTVTFYNEDGGFVGSVSNNMSASSNAWYLYLPSLQFLPDKYRGTAIINATSANGTTVGIFGGPSMAAAVYHVNYDRNAAISYDAIGQSAIAYKTDAVGELPCIPLGFTNCAWAAELYKTGTASAQSVVVGTETGIRLMNVDPLLTGAPAQVVAVYIDDSGVIWDSATQRFTIPPFGVHTLFPLYDSQIGETFRGTVRIMSTGNYVVGLANTVDYTVTDHDAAGSYNLQYNTGRTR